jgi:hypothetical protein
VLELAIDKKVEPVVIKDLQRHPAKNLVTHVDFLRIDMNKDIKYMFGIVDHQFKFSSHNYLDFV